MEAGTVEEIDAQFARLDQEPADGMLVEINPSPGFIFFERMTGQPISEAVARLLRGKDH
jgi:hypothetical protein